MSLAIVQRVRAKYPTPLGAKHGAFLWEVAGELGLGLVKKSWGTFVTLPDGTGVSQDCVMAVSGWHWDILQDGENLALPAWQLVEDEAHPGQPLILPSDRFYAVTPNPIQPEPEPSPPDQSDDIAALQRQVAALTRSLAAVNETANVAKETAAVAQESANGAMRYTTETREWVRQARVRGRTGSRFSHSHDVDLGLEWS